MTRLEQKLLRHGTFVGPVTPEMVTVAKGLYRDACERYGIKVEKDGWEDFIPDARVKVEAKNGWSV
jgi:hypothetical protein